MSEWQEIESAPRGGGADRVDDPKWVHPPMILLWCPEEETVAIGCWDWFYAEGGQGYEDGISAWVDNGSGDLIAHLFGEPTHWLPIPPPPQ